ncbi:DUF2264 domain-containing protein [Nesterenkonia halophila]|uniref:DUF2264 domain-containing protein n=1 Tax=Nesterenkonia halophila TaxID=302044 RepID=UPI001290C217|nr:DUF2264 domain-containing protein [Nesterenkonia halophila]
MTARDAAHLIELPAEDFAASPYTGFTRDHWVAVADHLVGSAWHWASPGRAHLNLPGRASRSGPQSDGLEGFARSMLAAAFRVAGADGEDPHGWLERYADGLRAGGSRPDEPGAEPWLPIRDVDAGGQPMVESACLALSLRLTRPWLWDQLDEQVQDGVARWLSGALHALPAANNWYLFPYTVAGFLESVGRGDEQTTRVRRRALDLLESWNCGDGWYTDGDGRSFDHYNGWALHFYPVLDDHLRGASGVHGSRLEEHLQEVRHLFGADGAPLHLGRSLTYRFAASTAVGLGALTGDTPMDPGESKRVLNSSLRYFLDRGSIGEDGLLSLGWHGPHAATVQSYSGPASPLWASKAFVALLLGEDSELWRATETERPIEREDLAFGMEPTGWAVQTTRDDGVVRVHNHGSDHVRPHQGEEPGDEDPLYARLAYSTSTGPTARGEVADNHVSVQFRGQRSVRRRIHPLGAGGGGGWAWAGSWHRPIFSAGMAALPGLRVESVVVVRGAEEVRIDRVVDAAHPVKVRHAGWAVDPAGELRSELRGLHGWEDEERLTSPAGTAFAPWVAIPAVRADVEGSAVLVSLARLAGTEEIASLTGVRELVVDDEQVSFRWADEQATITVRFDPFEVVRTDSPSA